MTIAAIVLGKVWGDIGDLNGMGFEGTILVEVNEEEYSVELIARGLKYIDQIRK